MAPRRVTGASETAKAFRELARLVAGPGNQACKRSLAPTLAAAQAGAPVETGTLRKSLTIKRDGGSPKTRPRYLVGPSSGTKGKDGRRPVKYAHLAEFGRRPNADGSGGHSGTRFLTRAYEATKSQVVENFGREFGPAVEAQAAKLAAKKAKS